MKSPVLLPEDILSAYRRIKTTVTRTPVLENKTLNSILGKSILFKCENLQKTGSFKYRGASHALSVMKEQHSDISHVVTHSSGNHGAALACAATNHGLKSTIVMPETSPESKQKNVMQHGGNIEFCQPTMASRYSTVERIILESGAELIHPFDDFLIMAGQGTAALEFINQASNLELVLAPVGGGGLLSGTATAIQSSQIPIMCIGVEPEIANDQYLSFNKKEIVEISDPDTIADGLRTTSPGEKPFATILEYVDSIVTVTEEGIHEAMKLIWHHLKVIVEPSGAVPFAAILEGKIPDSTSKIGIILSGGNLDLEKWEW